MINPRICAVIVTYKCDERITELLTSLLMQVQCVHIIDNGSEAAVLDRLLELAAENPDGICLTLNTSNLGIAAAQNQGIRQALATAFDWILLLDDDSLPEANMVQTMLRAWQQQNDAGIGILAPCLIEQNVSVASRHLVPWCNIGFKRKPVNQGEYLLDAITVIASGSLIRADVFRSAGLMTEGYFIDYVDHEFCLRARMHGFRIMVVGNTVLRHHQGNKRLNHILCLTIITQNYSPERYQYIFRNRLFFLRRYGGAFPFLIAHETMAYAWDMLRIIGCETDKSEKLWAAFRGLSDGMIWPIPQITHT
jgi:rhamnosyltransferase